MLATGGQSTNGGGGLVDLANAVYAAERWDPATGAWTELAPAAIARQYHSTALLLPDGRVLTGGGGICGACHRPATCAATWRSSRRPTSTGRDGSGALAPRPQITGAPAAIAYNAPFALSSQQAAHIRKVGLVRLGAPTHWRTRASATCPSASPPPGRR